LFLNILQGAQPEGARETTTTNEAPATIRIQLLSRKVSVLFKDFDAGGKDCDLSA
jgi:hypothetical protein